MNMKTSSASCPKIYFGVCNYWLYASEKRIPTFLGFARADDLRAFPMDHGEAAGGWPPRVGNRMGGKRQEGTFWILGCCRSWKWQAGRGYIVIVKGTAGGGVSGKPKEAVPRMSSKCCRVDREWWSDPMTVSVHEELPCLSYLAFLSSLFHRAGVGVARKQGHPEEWGDVEAWCGGGRKLDPVFPLPFSTAQAGFLLTASLQPWGPGSDRPFESSLELWLSPRTFNDWIETKSVI